MSSDANANDTAVLDARPPDGGGIDSAHHDGGDAGPTPDVRLDAPSDSSADMNSPDTRNPEASDATLGDAGLTDVSAIDATMSDGGITDSGALDVRDATTSTDAFLVPDITARDAAPDGGLCYARAPVSSAAANPSNPRCTLATRNNAAACGTDTACIAAALNADTTPAAADAVWGSVNCARCVMLTQLHCIAQPCAREDSALACCQIRNCPADPSAGCLSRNCPSEYQAYFECAVGTLNDAGMLMDPGPGQSCVATAPSGSDYDNCFPPSPPVD